MRPRLSKKDGAGFPGRVQKNNETWSNQTDSLSKLLFQDGPTWLRQWPHKPWMYGSNPAPGILVLLKCFLPSITLTEKGIKITL